MPVLRPKVLPDGKLQFEFPYPKRVVGYRRVTDGVWEPDFEPCSDRTMEVATGGR